MKSRGFLLAAAGALCFLSPCFAASAHDQLLLIPAPRELAVWGDGFILDENVSIVVPSKASEEDLLLSGFLADVVALARGGGKEPTRVKRDIRGFITNRLMYALLRKAFHLVEAGYATLADVDRSMRNDLGYWIVFAGPFRFMDLTGIPAYASVMKDLFPELDCSREVPALMRQVVESGGRGVSNAQGFYEYTPEQAERWEKLFLRYSYDIRAVAQKYPEDVGDREPEPASP